MCSLKVDSSLDETALKLLFEVKNIILETLSFLHLPALDVVVDVLLVDLVHAQPAQVVLGLPDHRLVVQLVNLPQSIGPQLPLIDRVLVPFVEHEVQDLLRLDLSLHIGLPDVPGSNFEFLIISADVGNDHQLLQRIVEMLLIVVERGVLHLLCLLLLPSRNRLLEAINFGSHRHRESSASISIGALVSAA